MLTSITITVICLHPPNLLLDRAIDSNPAVGGSQAAWANPPCLLSVEGTDVGKCDSQQVKLMPTFIKPACLATCCCHDQEQVMLNCCHLGFEATTHTCPSQLSILHRYQWPLQHLAN